MAAIQITPVGDKQAYMRIFNDDLTSVSSTTLTMKELIDLEGMCTAVRMQLEVGDQPKDKNQRKDIDALYASLKADQKLADSVSAYSAERTKDPKPKNLQEFFARLDIDFRGEMEQYVYANAPVKSVNGLAGHVQIEGTQYELRTTVAANTANPVPEDQTVRPDEIGQLVDSISHNSRVFRNWGRVARRALEECVELCLACGAHANEILGSVGDSLHNQALKASYRSEGEDEAVTVFPSQLRMRQGDSESVVKELADVRLVLADLMYLVDVSEPAVGLVMREKFNKLSSVDARFATDGHTFYLRKSHIKDNTPST
jgi:hypothetical protein